MGVFAERSVAEPYTSIEDCRDKRGEDGEVEDACKEQADENCFFLEIMYNGMLTRSCT
jgi:hypothetical protein